MSNFNHILHITAISNIFWTKKKRQELQALLEDLNAKIVWTFFNVKFMLKCHKFNYIFKKYTQTP